MKLPLSQGSYVARNVTANAQECINLIPEPNPPDAPFPITHYPAPGLSISADYTGQYAGTCRGLYFTSNGRMIAVIGINVLRMVTGSGETPAQAVLLGTLLEDTSPNMVIMCDNQTDLVIVDGSPRGYWIPLSAIDGPPSQLQQIDDPAFYGSSRVDFIDTFLIFNWPGTPTWYSTISNELLPFDAQYFAAKEGYNDMLVAVVALHDNVWVIGNITTEIWFNAGGSLFPFARMPNSVLQQGVVGPYALVVTDNAIYWLSQDRFGRNMLIRGEGYAARRVSTFAVEQEWNTYPIVSDAVLMSFQFAGHETIGIWFPTSGHWWSYDASTQLFHRRTYGDTTTAWLPSCTAYWGHVEGVTYEVNNLCAGDRTGPRVYLVNRNAYTDNGTPIIRLRRWMHMVNDGKRQVYTRFSAAMDGSQLSPDTVMLNWSDNGGRSWNIDIPQTCGNDPSGQYQWRRLGYARDRVFQLQWQGTGDAALNGAWVDVIPEMT